jgi:hypothetical protein
LIVVYYMVLLAVGVPSFVPLTDLLALGVAFVGTLDTAETLLLCLTLALGAYLDFFFLARASLAILYLSISAALIARFFLTYFITA